MLLGRQESNFWRDYKANVQVSYLLSFWRRWRTIDFLKRLLWNGGSWVLLKNVCRGAKFGLGGLPQTVLWAWLDLPTCY